MLKRKHLKKINYKRIFRNFLYTVIIFLFSISLFLSLYSYNSFDPSPFTVTDEIASNYLGKFGATMSSIIFFIFGDASWLIIFSLLLSWRLLIIEDLKIINISLRLLLSLIAIFMLSISVFTISLNSGMIGKVLLSKLMKNSDIFAKYETYYHLFNILLFTNVYFLSFSRSIISFYSSFLKLFSAFLKAIFWLLSVPLKRKIGIFRKISNCCKF